ncbi:MAG: hypothetical protein WAM18_08675 [Halobacillus sp.]|uniref:hypothetical protein n=1 Tax=Halobacillus sp. TaxID=56800 RepID=UPI003BAFBF34
MTIRGNWAVYVDANSGQVIDQYNKIMHAQDYQSSKGSGIGVVKSADYNGAAVESTLT